MRINQIEECMDEWSWHEIIIKWKGWAWSIPEIPVIDKPSCEYRWEAATIPTADHNIIPSCSSGLSQSKWGGSYLLASPPILFFFRCLFITPPTPSARANQLYDWPKVASYTLGTHRRGTICSYRLWIGSDKVGLDGFNPTRTPPQPVPASTQR